MSTTAPAPTNGHQRKLNGVRTYRGRKLEDLIPKIRAELGPDAIILREREGLMGGINGFFAQRFVEVEARAGTPRVDVYDDEDELDTPAAPAAATPEPPAKRRAAPAPPATPAAATPPPVSAPSALSADLGLSAAESFARQLEEAAATAFDDFGLEPEPEPVVPEPEPEPDPEPIAPEPEAAMAEPEPMLPEVVVPEAALPAAVVVEPEPAPVNEEPVSAKPKRAPSRKPRRGPSGRFARALSAAAPGNAQAQPTQAEQSIPAGVARDLVDTGISDAWAHQLIGEAGAHAAPFARQGGLRSAVRGALASSILPARPLPATGAAVAFVGAGGAGKTRCAATLAAAYKRASTLSVSAMSLGSTDNGRELADLLRAHGVSVAAGKDGAGLARRVQKGRQDGIVVIDTPAVAPSDQVAVHALAAELEQLELDAVYVVLPATLGARTGKRLLSGLAPLRPSGLAISHADETDQLGIATELASASRIPITYIHEGLDIETALSATDPADLADRLLS